VGATGADWSPGPKHVNKQRFTFGLSRIAMTNKPEKCGEIIKHLMHALDIADELEDGGLQHI
jgi:hypothetical protein